MNLFAVDYDPVKAAQALPDKHVVKMCIENAQMLAVALGDLHGLGWGEIRKKRWHILFSTRSLQSSFYSVGALIIRQSCMDYCPRIGIVL